MKKRAKEVEQLWRFARRRPEWAFRQMCRVQIDSDLDIHMMGTHLELGQLWRCPVEWCAVWKGSVSDCHGHFNEKHGGSAFFALGNVSKFFPPWTVTRDVWQVALRPDVSGIAVDTRLFRDAGYWLVHKYRVYRDPFPHPALRDGVIPRLISFVDMAIACLTKLHILIPVSGMPPGQVLAECFPGGTSTHSSTNPRRVSFATAMTVLGDSQGPVDSPDVNLCAPSVPDALGTDLLITAVFGPDASSTLVPPPPGFRQLCWPHDDWMVGGAPCLEPGLQQVTSGSLGSAEGRPVDPPSLPLSPFIADNSDDSVAVQVQSSRDESCIPSQENSSAEVTAMQLPSADTEFNSTQWAPAVTQWKSVAVNRGGCSPNRIPRWRLAREGPFLDERSSSVIRAFGAGCAFRQTTYSASDYASPSGAFGVPLNLPRFLEWIGVPESATLLEMGPGKWLDSLSMDMAMAAAIQLHRDVCLMTTNLNILDQYALSLQGAASKMLETSLGCSVYPAADVAAGALGPYGSPLLPFRFRVTVPPRAKTKGRDNELKVRENAERKGRENEKTRKRENAATRKRSYGI